MAGIADDSPSNSFLKNLAIRVLKSRSDRTVLERRAEAVGALENAGHDLRFVNRGGTGAMGVDKEPKPVLPEGAELTQEGAGKVQTPVRYDGEVELSRGDPVFFRHAKAGELCEGFDRLVLVSDDEAVCEETTYRGDGRCFI